MQERFGAAQFDGHESFFAAVDPATLDRTLQLDYAAGGTDGLEGDGCSSTSRPPSRAACRSATSCRRCCRPATGSSLTVGGRLRDQPGRRALRHVARDPHRHGRHPARPLRLRRRGRRRRPRGGAVGPDRGVGAYPVVDLKDQEEFAEEQRGQVAQLLLLINALLVLSVIIAVLGIVNTLALSVIERTREIGLLRAVGLSRSQLRRMVRLESVVISVYGAALGLVLGTVFGVSLARALSGQGIEVLVVPGARLAAFLLVGRGHRRPRRRLAGAARRPAQGPGRDRRAVT
jgi:putative ABC transport system permease protein